MGKERQPHEAAIEFGEKFTNIYESKGYEKEEIANILGVKRSYLYKIRDGLRVPSPEVVSNFIVNLELDHPQIDFLITPWAVLLQEGYGTPRGERSPQTSERIGKAGKGRTPSIKSREKMSVSQIERFAREKRERKLAVLESGINQNITD